MSLIPPPPPTPQTDSKERKRNVFVSPFEQRVLETKFIIDEIKSLGRHELDLLNNSNVFSSSFCEENKNSTLGMLMVSSIVQPILQHGPICGLVALAMAAEAISNSSEGSDKDNTAQTSRILEQAIENGYTKNGEMFSAENMTILARSCIKCEAELKSTANTATNDAEIRDYVLSNCLNGNYVLVPYDADRNHRPGLFKGHCAHWALIQGFALLLENHELRATLQLWSMNEETMKSMSSPHDDDDNIVLRVPSTLNKIQKEVVAEMIRNSKESHIYVLARQGKSSHVGLWPFKELIESNRNLKEIDPKIVAKSDEFILSSIDTSLQAKIVVLRVPP